ncbi:metallophosphoesterase [Tateyamaria sp.]|nr:metallophosphoesterase [Tateyamaria sp.]
MVKLSLPDDVTVMGDPHLGRKFKTGVPLHRVGDREAAQWAQFEHELMSCETPYHVNMGDLFDKFVVAPEVVLKAAEIYKHAAADHPNTMYFILEGNHDRAKDSSKASSFDLFAQLVAGIWNIFVVSDGVVNWENRFGFVPYHPFRPTSELVEELPGGLDAIFGHWDIQDWGGDNVIPTKLMKQKKVKLAVSGHDHLAREERRDGVPIIVTGSMQPYTHAEDDTGEFYKTVTLEQLAEIDATNLNVRVLLKEGESLPAELDCLSLTAKRITNEDDKIEVDTSDFDSLDLGQMLARALEGLSIADTLMEAFNDA